MLPKTSTFTVYDDEKEVEHLVKVAKNMGYKYSVKVQPLAGCDTGKTVTSVTWIRRA
jgi:putative aminopeptidase FrvX